MPQDPDRSRRAKTTPTSTRFSGSSPAPSPRRTTPAAPDVSIRIFGAAQSNGGALEAVVSELVATVACVQQMACEDGVTRGLVYVQTDQPAEHEWSRGLT